MTYTVQVHRTSGADEDFEAGSRDEASAIVKAEWSDERTRRIVVIRSDGHVQEWSR